MLFYKKNDLAVKKRHRTFPCPQAEKISPYGKPHEFFRDAVCSWKQTSLSLEIAHPDHRDALMEAAKKLGYVPREQYLGSQGAYPVHEERRLGLAKGNEVLIRPAHAADADAIRNLFHNLSPDDVYTRFFRRVRSLTYQDLQTLCNVNHETQVAFLAVTGPREHEVVVGSACYFLNPTTNLAEVGYMVAPNWQGQDLGSALQARLQEYAMSRGVRGFVAEILANNERMVRLAAKTTGVATTTREDETLQVTTLFSDVGKPKPEEKPAAEEKPAKAAPKRKGRRTAAK